MKIYTKTGDQGTTSLLGGTRVDKNHIQIEAYGTVDELNAYLGLVRDLMSDKFEFDQKLIIEIQRELFTIGSHLANDKTKANIKLPTLNTNLVHKLENNIDEMDATLPPMKFFVLPGGNTTVSHIHIARTICRRAERRVLEVENTDFKKEMIQFINRLSDWLFVLSRKHSAANKAIEQPWEWK